MGYEGFYVFPWVVGFPVLGLRTKKKGLKLASCYRVIAWDSSPFWENILELFQSIEHSQIQGGATLAPIYT